MLSADQSFLKSSLENDGFTSAESDSSPLEKTYEILDGLSDISIEPNQLLSRSLASVKSKASTECLTERKISVGPQHFDILTLIGEGAFGKVLLVRNKLNDKTYAMKVISKKLLKKKNHISYMKSEREILTKANHPFVVPLRFAFQTEKRLFLVMDYLSGGELFFHLRRRGVILEQEVSTPH